MISEAARTRPTTTSSHNEAPTGADNTTAMMMPLPDLDRLKGPQDRLCCLVLCMGAGLLVTMAKLGRARSAAQSVRLHNRSVSCKDLPLPAEMAASLASLTI